MMALVLSVPTTLVHPLTPLGTCFETQNPSTVFLIQKAILQVLPPCYLLEMYVNRVTCNTTNYSIRAFTYCMAWHRVTISACSSACDVLALMQSKCAVSSASLVASRCSLELAGVCEKSCGDEGVSCTLTAYAKM